MDRNLSTLPGKAVTTVALRKESVDRNFYAVQIVIVVVESLSARRAWIEILMLFLFGCLGFVALRKESVDRNDVLAVSALLELVALRKESVDRNFYIILQRMHIVKSLSARRAWIEILYYGDDLTFSDGRSPQGERG